MMYKKLKILFMFAVFAHLNGSQASDNVILSLSHPSNVARFAPKTKDGLLDKTFGAAGNGTVTTNVTADNDIAYSMVLQPDGKIVVAGRSGGYFALARYTNTVSLDQIAALFPQGGGGLWG